MAKTQGKRVRMPTTNDIHDGLNRDADFEDDKSERERQSRLDKRQRTSTTPTEIPIDGQQVRGKSSQVVRFEDVPIGIFIKIASHLEPVDIILLARLNKSFRNFLMRQSSVEVWRRSMENVLGLPDCPSDMSEPCYLALVFLTTCTSCGEARKTEMNEVLRVRLLFAHVNRRRPLSEAPRRDAYLQGCPLSTAPRRLSSLCGQ
ncbi:hypothetical protein FRC12_018983 [Ceratobasidium sp. 428]|nr:hypothetical protein FRC12_018983 [Ceratobasidium sp. 428]